MKLIPLLKNCIFLLLAVFTIKYTTVAQNADIFELLDSNNNQGSIVIFQDSSIYNLMAKQQFINNKINGIQNGYRIQIFSASGYDARKKILSFKENFLDNYPEFDQNEVYQLYQPPFFKLRVGDYRNKNEAIIVYKKLVRDYPNCYIVKSAVNFPKLKE
ncbi:MAG: S49 family peptidase [Chlorobi bacterium]|nr:S49 family peptidase [Chlorobiota bacterium]